MTFVVALHIIGLITWMGALLMLSRLLGFHVTLESGEARKKLEQFEHRTYFWAGAPGALLTYATGFGMLFLKGASAGHYLAPGGPWGSTFHLKLTLVFFLFVVDHMIMRRMKKLHRGELSGKKPFVILHGSIGVLFMVIVIAVKTNLLGG